MAKTEKGRQPASLLRDTDYRPFIQDSGSGAGFAFNLADKTRQVVQL
jgi:hypothetical protein